MITVLIVLVGLSAIILMAEAAYMMPDKMPWNRRKKK